MAFDLCVLVSARNAHYICIIIADPGSHHYDDEEDDADADLHHLPGTILDWIGGRLHGDPGGSKQVPVGG